MNTSGTPPARRFILRFRLWTIMILTAIVAVSVSAMKWLIEADPGIAKAVTASAVVLAPFVLMAIASLTGQLRPIP